MPVGSVPVDGISSRGGRRAVSLDGVNYPHYKARYPNGLDFRPQSEVHEHVLGMLLDRVRVSHGAISKRYSDWKEIQDSLTAFIRHDEEEELIKQTDPRKPVSIVIPSSYAVLDTLLTYFVAAFLEDPIFRYVGQGPEDDIGAALMEKVIALHCVQSKVPLALHTMWRDSLSVGIGPVIPGWVREVELRTRRKPKKRYNFTQFRYVETGQFTQEIEEAVAFEGNKLENIDPFMFLPDPNVPVHKAHEGEFVGWMDSDNKYHLMVDEETDDELFNVQYLRQLSATSQYYQTSARYRGITDTPVVSRDSQTSNTVHRTTMYVDLVPEEWKLGRERRPELWLFQIAGEGVIIKAKQVRLNHRKKPVRVCAPDFDGYSVSPISRLEIVQPIQGVVDWMMNTYVASVRKVLHDVIVYDPSMVNTADLKDPKPGKLVRLRLSAFGRVSAKDAIHQLDVKNVTEGHPGFAQAMSELMFQASGAQDSVQGIRRKSGERVTATEFRGVQSSALSRLEKLAKVASIQVHTDIARMFASHLQQFMSEDVWIQSTGDWPKVLAQEYGDQQVVRVTPEDISVGYDIVAKDGSVPSTEYADTWVELFRILSANPQLARKFDMVRVFQHIARLAGARNVQQFLLKGGQIDETIVSDQEVELEKARGNIKPIGGGTPGV